MSADSGSSYLMLLAIYLVAVGMMFQLMGNRDFPTLLLVASMAFAVVSLLMRLPEESTGGPQ